MPRYNYRNKRMLSVVGESLLNIGTVEFTLATGIPILQRQFGLEVAVCYRRPDIPSLDLQSEPCRLLHRKTADVVREDEQHYREVWKTLDHHSQSDIRLMFRFVELADYAEDIYLSLGLLLPLMPSLHRMRNGLMHSTKLESDEGLLVTTAKAPARLIPWRALQCFSRKSRQASYLASMLRVSAVSANHGLYASFGNDSYHSRFLLRCYRDGIKNLGSRWRQDLAAMLNEE